MTKLIFGIKPEDYWCHHVYRVEKNGKPYIGAIVKRKYGEGFEDVDRIVPSKRIGIEYKGSKRMIWDNNTESETFQQRIEDPTQEEDSEKINYFTIEMTDKAIDEIRKMCSSESNYGHTQYFRLYHEKSPIEAETLDELVEFDNKYVYDTCMKTLKLTKEQKKQ